MLPQIPFKVRAPREPHTPVTQTACNVLSHKAQGSLSWGWEQPSHNLFCTAASTSPGSREGHGCTQKESTRTPLSLLPLMLSPSTLLWSLQAPTVVSRVTKAFVFPPQLVILEIALSEDKVQRWHQSTRLGSSSKVHISLQAGCPSPHFLRTKQLMLSPSLSLLTLSSRCSRGEECKQSLRGKTGRGDMDLPSTPVRTAYP